MSARTPVASELLVVPEWVAVALYFVVVPLGLLVGYLAFRGFRRTDRRSAELLAVGIILLTVVDTVLATSVDVAGLVDLTRATPLARGVVQLLGVAAIVYAMYRPERERAEGYTGGTPPVEPPPRSDDPTRGGAEDRNGAPAERDGDPE